VLAGLLLSTLGVDDQVIAADYARSEAAMEDLVAWVRAKRGDEAADNMTGGRRPFLRCPPEAMVGFLEGTRAAFGGIDGYLSHLGVAEATVTRLRLDLLTA
jgi:protein-tyrosine phosphatase